MKTQDIPDPLFREAVEAIDSGNLEKLSAILIKNPEMVAIRSAEPSEEGYFKNPYLLWFVADNPIRHPKLPDNISAITELLIDYAKEHAADSFQFQIDYTLGLVATGSVPRESGVQIQLMDTLINAGAIPGKGHGALAHGNKEAAAHLIKRGGEITLTSALILDMENEIESLLKSAEKDDLQIALMAAAFYGDAFKIKQMIEAGADVNVYLDRSSGFHSHASALHQAISSQSMESVKLLVENGARLDAKDRVYHGTPLGWARYMQTETNDPAAIQRYADIEKWLAAKME